MKTIIYLCSSLRIIRSSFVSFISKMGEIPEIFWGLVSSLSSFLFLCLLYFISFSFFLKKSDFPSSACVRGRNRARKKEAKAHRDKKWQRAAVFEEWKEAKGKNTSRALPSFFSIQGERQVVVIYHSNSCFPCPPAKKNKDARKWTRWRKMRKEEKEGEASGQCGRTQLDVTFRQKYYCVTQILFFFEKL